MRKLLIIILSLIVLVATSCLKDTASTDLSHEGSILELMYPPAAQFNGVGSGLEYFGGGALSYPATDIVDTVTFYVNIAGTNTLGKSLSVTIAADPGALQDNYSRDSITYVAMPAADFTIINATQTIPAGSRMDTFQVAFYPSKFDITQNFMLALTVTNNGGVPLAANFGHLYLHTIGNPLAGTYVETGSRNNYIGGSGWAGPPAPIPPPASSNDLSSFGGGATLDNTTTIELPYSNLGSSGDNLIITFNAAGPSISVTGNSTLLGGVANFKVWVETITINGSGKATMHIVTSYTNGAGNDRINDETFVQQ
ncbi:MAG TPA: DUF1735 domain-containing protein [Puia sp.]|jgi:hypothetical protein|nr:DUF1735 domain-containing protein [Puia sp.]